MELLLIFGITLLVLIGLVLALAFGRPPAYRPSRRDVLALLQDVANGRAREDQWYLFLSLPVTHDPVLEGFRQRCLLIDEGDEKRPPSGPGIDDNIYCKEGRARIASLAKELAAIIQREPVYREF